MKKSIIIGIVLLVVVLVFFLILNPRLQSYLQLQKRLEEGNLQKRYQRVVSSLSFELPETPDSEKTLDMPNFITRYGTCYYDSGASVANYMENISFDEFVWYGRPLMFQHYDGEYGVRMGPLRGELAEAAFYNLGYIRYCGNTSGKLPVSVPEGASDPDFKIDSDRDLGASADYMGSRDDIMDSYDNYVFFRSGEEALGFVKKLMSTDRPSIVIIKDWSKLGHFQTLFGYNETHIVSPRVPQTPKLDWLDKPLPEFYEQPLDDEHRESFTNEDFLEKIWGPKGHSFCWFDKTGAALTKKEMLKLNKKDALEAPENIQKLINGLLKSSYRGDAEDIPMNGVVSVAAASRYLGKQGYDKLADKYLEIASLYNEIGEGHQAVDWPEIKEIYQEAADLWSEVEL